MQTMRTLTPPGDWASFKLVDIPTGAIGTYAVDELALIQSTWGVCMHDKYMSEEAIPPGEHVILIYQCEKILVRKTHGTGQGILVGQKVYVDDSLGNAPWSCYGGNVKADPADTCIGICVQDATADDEFVLIDLGGDDMTDQP